MRETRGWVGAKKFRGPEKIVRGFSPELPYFTPVYRILNDF